MGSSTLAGTPAVWAAHGAVLLAATVTGGLHAQAPEPGWALGAAASASLLVGGASDFLDSGFGLSGFAARRAAGPAWIRVDVDYVGLAAAEAPGERADNAIATFVVGPELGFGGSPVGAYIRGYAGFAANFQSRSGSDVAAETSWAGSFGGGAGVRVRLGGERRPLALDLGGAISKTGDLEFARTAVSGSTSIQDVAVLTLRAGLTIGLP